MNAFYEHHKDSIRFGYRCFDRILLNGLIQPFQQPERMVGLTRSHWQRKNSWRHDHRRQPNRFKRLFGCSEAPRGILA
jgi:hypothetical protein